MNPFEKLFSYLGLKGLRQPFSAGATSRFSLQFGGQRGGFIKKASYIEEYKNWVFACVNIRAKAIANIQLFLTKDGVLVEESDIMTLLNRVNKGMTMYDLFFNTQAFKDLDGNAYWYLARDKDGKGAIKEIYVLKADKVVLVPSDSDPLNVAGYIFIQADGKRVPFAPNEILHFKNFNPNGYAPFPYKGMSVVEGASWAIDTDNEIRKWNFNFFKNGARPDGVLEQSGDGTMDEATYKRIKEQWSSEHQGSENAYKTAILSGGLKWTKIGESQSELDFASQKELNRDEIASLFEVPKFLLGVTDSINRATAEAATYVFAQFTIKPLMQQLVNTLNEFLVPEFGDGYKLEFKSPVEDDRATVIAEYTAGIDKWLSRNEIRKRENLPPTKEGDQFLTPFNLQPMDEIIPPKEIKKLEKPKAKSEAEKIVENFVSKKSKKEVKVEKKEEIKPSAKVEETIAKFQAKLPTAKTRGLTVDQKEAFKVEWKALIESNTKPLVKKLEKYFNAQEKEVLENVKSQLKGVRKSQYKTKALNLFDEKDAVKMGISLITPNIQTYIDNGGANGAKLTGITFDNETSAITDFIASRSAFFAKKITDTTYDLLTAQIQEGTDAGESIADISKRIESVYEEARGYRSEMIARTEVSAGQNFGSIEAYDQAGVELLEWTVVDPQDADCLENEGVEVKIGDNFPSGDSQPPVHPNCVCGTLPVFNE